MECISDGGLGPASRGNMTPDEVCARDFFMHGSAARVAYKCERGAKWACCEASVGQQTQQELQNLGSCERYPGEEVAGDEEGTGDGNSEDVKDAGIDNSEPPKVLKIE